MRTLCFSYFDIFPNAAPSENTNSTDAFSFLDFGPEPEPGMGKSPSTMASYQALGLFITLVIAIIGGIVTGKLDHVEN